MPTGEDEERQILMILAGSGTTRPFYDRNRGLMRRTAAIDDRSSRSSLSDGNVPLHVGYRFGI